MKYLQIRNAEEIDPNALTLMGASTKRGEVGQIGFFGTGNKYALACFLRKELKVLIFSGESEIVIATETVALGGQEFSMITVNGLPTSLTTDVGITWDLWQAVREVYSNALDSGLEGVSVGDDIKPRPGTTLYCIEASDSINDIIENWDAYFAKNREPIYRAADGRAVYEGSGSIFRFGIRCNLENAAPAAYDYELGDLGINEERLYSKGWQVSYLLWDLVLNSDDPTLILRVLKQSADSNTLESRIYSSQDLPAKYSETTKRLLKDNLFFTDAMRTVMSKYEQEEGIQIAQGLLDKFIAVLGREEIKLPKTYKGAGNGIYAELEPTDMQRAVIEQAVKLIEGAGMEFVYPVAVGRFFNEVTMGYADRVNDVVVLADTTFSRGDVMVVGTLIEEFVHLHDQANDCTREMQDALVNHFATYLLNGDGS